jgi:hypothetical protein
VFSDVQSFSVQLKSLLGQVFQKLVTVFKDCLSGVPDEATLATVAAHLETELLVMVCLLFTLKAASTFFTVDD